MLVTLFRRGRTICLAWLLDFPLEYASGQLVLKGKIPLALKYLAESAQRSPVQMKRLKRAWQ